MQLIINNSINMIVLRAVSSYSTNSMGPDRNPLLIVTLSEESEFTSIVNSLKDVVQVDTIQIINNAQTTVFSGTNYILQSISQTFSDEQKEGVTITFGKVEDKTE